MTSIHPLRPEDHDAWRELWEGYLTFYESGIGEEVTEGTFQRLIDDEALHGALARDADGRAIGLVHWLTHPATWSMSDYCYLEDLYVAPEQRGSGAGRALIQHVRDWAAEEGCAKLYWLTQEQNSTARSLYDRVARHTGFTHYQVALGD